METTRGRKRQYPKGCNQKCPIRKMNRQQTAELLRGVPIVQLDYNTGEYIDEYPSMTALALDYEAPLASIIGAFQKSDCCMVKLPSYQLLLIRKKDYETMIKGARL